MLLEGTPVRDIKWTELVPGVEYALTLDMERMYKVRGDGCTVLAMGSGRLLSTANSKVPMRQVYSSAHCRR